MADPDLLQRITREIRERLEELRPFVSEAERLEKALAALEGQPVAGDAARTRPGRTRGGRSPRGASA